METMVAFNLLCVHNFFAKDLIRDTHRKHQGMKDQLRCRRLRMFGQCGKLWETRRKTKTPKIWHNCKNWQLKMLMISKSTKASTVGAKNVCCENNLLRKDPVAAMFGLDNLCDRNLIVDLRRTRWIQVARCSVKQFQVGFSSAGSNEVRHGEVKRVCFCGLQRSQTSIQISGVFSVVRIRFSKIAGTNGSKRTVNFGRRSLLVWWGYWCCPWIVSCCYLLTFQILGTSTKDEEIEGKMCWNQLHRTVVL